MLSTSATKNTVRIRLSRVDRFLPLLILIAMALGVSLSKLIPQLSSMLGSLTIQGTSVPIAIGLLVMMYPPLAKIRYDKLHHSLSDKGMLLASIALNWLIGPAVMFSLAWIFLGNQPSYRTGLILVGLARCIAMVLVWNDLACGDREGAAVLVALNSLFQIFAYALLGWFYLMELPKLLGLSQASISFSVSSIAISVGIFLGIPLVLGYLTRNIGERMKGRSWYETKLIPKISPFALYGLLFTVILLFALQGSHITAHPLDVVRIAIPLLCYFAIMWSVGLLAGFGLKLPYTKAVTVAFTAAGNNFELAIAVTIATFGISSGQALASVVGPLIEVPALISLVYVALALKNRLTWTPESGH